MKKLKPFSVKNMTTLSREAMAKVHGGDFTVYDCKAGNAGKYCAISIQDWIVHLGVCTYSSTTTVTGFVNTYYCAPISN